MESLLPSKVAVVRQSVQALAANGTNGQITLSEAHLFQDMLAQESATR